MTAGTGRRTGRRTMEPVRPVPWAHTARGSRPHDRKKPLNDTLASSFAFVNELHPVLQFLAVLGIGTVPFLESYVASPLGVLGQLPWPLALAGAVAGNTLAIVAAVLLAGRMRARKSRVAGSERRERILARVDKWGVPLASLLAPTVFAISLTAFIMVVGGLNQRAVLVWNVIASLAWGALMTGSVIAALSALG